MKGVKISYRGGRCTLRVGAEVYRLKPSRIYYLPSNVLKAIPEDDYVVLG